MSVKRSHDQADQHCLPCYNEEENIEELVTRVRQVMQDALPL